MSKLTMLIGLAWVIVPAGPALALNELFLEMITGHLAPYSSPDDYIYFVHKRVDSCLGASNSTGNSVALGSQDRARHLMAFTQIETCPGTASVEAGNITASRDAPLLSVESVTRGRIGDAADDLQSLRLGNVSGGDRLKSISNHVRATFGR